MDGKIEKKLSQYNGLSYGEIAIRALKEKGNLKRKEDDLFLKVAEENFDILFFGDSFLQQRITRSLSKLVSVPYVNILNEFIDKKAISLVPIEIIKEKEFLPISKQGKRLIVAVVNPLHMGSIKNIPKISGYNIKFVLCQKSHFLKVFNNHVPKEMRTINIDTVKDTDGIKKNEIVKKSKPKNSLTNVRLNANLSSAVSMIDAIIATAVIMRATDIHFESEEEETRVRFRIDGMLYNQLKIPYHLQKASISRLKVLANLDITETKIPQDGRMTSIIEGNEYHFRVSSIKTKRGENVVLRIFKEKNVFTELSRLGMGSEDVALFNSIINKPYGMVLVTGPIGSGKTTTLYTAIQELDTSKNKIITIEDPVECLLSNVNQIEVDPKIDMNFVNSLRAVLRHDADVLMVGEVRDTETAKIAVRAALTGQLLFSTLHAVDTASAITSLRNFDIQPFLIASSLNGIVAQRLVRKICNNCKEEYTPSIELLKQLAINENEFDFNIKFAYGKGCDACSNIGFYGQTGIFEILRINEDIRDVILKQANEKEIKKLTFKQKLRTLRDGGIKKIFDKITTPDEVMREIFLKG